MKRLFSNMVRWALGILPVLLTVANAMAQKSITYIEVEQCESYEFSVVDWPGDRYTWDLYTKLEWDTVNFATQDGNLEPVPFFDKGMYEGSTVKVNWLDTGRYFLRIVAWDEVGCTNNLLVFIIDVIEHKPTATVEDGELCYGDPVVFKIVLTGMGPWDLKYTYDDGIAAVNVNGITEPEITIKMPPLPPGIHEVWVQEIIDQCSSNLIPSDKGRIVIFPKPVNSKIYPVSN